MHALRNADVVVVGAGVLGLATTLALRQAGADVLCLEANAPGCAQSAGQTRIFRHSYTRPEIVELAATARRGWDQWSQDWGTTLIEPTGSLLVPEDLDRDAATLRTTGVPFTLLDPHDEERAIPWRKARADRPALFETSAGTIRAARTIAGLRDGVGDALQIATAYDIQPQLTGEVVVRANDVMVRAGMVLICAGADTARLAATAGVTVPVVDHPHSRAVFRLRDHSLDAMAVPSFRDKAEHPLGAIYTYGVPVGPHEVAIGLEPPDNTGTYDALSAVQATVDYVAAMLPGLDPDPVRLESCDSTALDTSGTAPWESEGMGVWGEGNVRAFGGGHYFKFAPVLGQLLAEVALGGDVPAILDPTSLSASPGAGQSQPLPRRGLR